METDSWLKKQLSNSDKKDSRERLFTVLKNAGDFLDFDVEIISKSREESFYKTLFIRYENLQYIKSLANSNLSFYFKISDNYYFNLEKTVYEYCLNNLMLDELIIKMLKAYKKSRMTASKIGKLFEMPFDNEQKKYAVLLKGFLHKCDYSASENIKNYEYEVENDFLNSTMQNWLDSNLEIQLNSLQKFCLANTNSNIVVTAPTGMGKTEAGLFWCGNHKCFFVLPIKTAINAMYERIMRLSGDEYKKRVALIHSDMKAIYLEQNKTDDFDTDYCMVSKQMSLPITVCTPGQIFDFVMKYPGYEYKLAVGSYSRFIIR